jgi:hypothetical protein
MEYRPKFQKQLNGKGAIPVPGKTKGARDCGPRASLHGIDALTHGELLPSVSHFRAKAGVSGPQKTNIYDLQRGIEAYTPRGRKPLRLFIKSFVGDVKTAVSSGKGVLLCIHYGKFNQLANKTGDPYYTGGHSISVFDERGRGDDIEWLLYDSLDDARREGIPQGERWVKRSIIVESMEAFAGARGRCYAGVFGGGQKR